jgi:hypothetical protein
MLLPAKMDRTEFWMCPNPVIVTLLFAKAFEARSRAPLARFGECFPALSANTRSTPSSPVRVFHTHHPVADLAYRFDIRCEAALRNDLAYTDRWRGIDLGSRKTVNEISNASEIFIAAKIPIPP